MKFEYDESKSLINKEKHGIDFVDEEKGTVPFFSLFLNSEARKILEAKYNGFKHIVTKSA